MPDTEKNCKEGRLLSHGWQGTFWLLIYHDLSNETLQDACTLGQLDLPEINLGPGKTTAGIAAESSAKLEEVAVPKLESNASDQSARPLGLSAAGSAARSFPGTLLQFARESSKPEEVGEAEESMECASLTSEESLAPLQTVIVVRPNADGDLGEVSVEVTASANPLTVPRGRTSSGATC